jgi:diguanylate cyclase (GGDEF)-like protein/PAS domain S-box-containing protein
MNPPAAWCSLVDALPQAVWLVDQTTLELIAANAAAAALLGCEREALIGASAASLAATPEDLCYWDDAACGAREPLSSQSYVRRFDGSTVPVARSVRHVVLDGRGLYLVALHDCSAQQRSERELELAAAELAATLESTADGILVTDLAGRIRRCNRRFAELWGLPDDLLLERDDAAIADWMRRSVTDPAAYGRRLAEIAEATLLQASDVLHLHGGRVLERIVMPQCSRGRPIGRVFSFRDISERVAASRQIETLSRTDALTGLPNRSLLAERVERALALAAREGEPFAMLLLDIDHFKHINDTLGHAFGDRVLVEIGERLTGSVRQIDTVARLGGDEFVLLAQRSEAGGAEATARRVMESLQRPFTLDGLNFTVTASIGIALHPADGASLDELLRHADAAMREAKGAGRAAWRFHAPGHDAGETERRQRMQLDHAMRQALARDRFQLHYQPQVAVHTGSVVGAEALIRWRDPELGDVSPAHFIPVAEESGFIVPIGDWVLRQAVAQAARWHAGGRPTRMSVNVSALQFRQPGFVDGVARVLADHALPGHLLELELTESILIQNVEDTLARVHALAALGVQLAIDDFGTGYSSLGYLKRLPIARLKIDRSFIVDLPGDTSGASIVDAVINLGRALGLQVIAEGVESEAQRRFLGRCGCHEFQGWLFAPALPAEQFEALLAPQATPRVVPLPRRSARARRGIAAVASGD